jgi:hypothetical protein
VNPDVKAAWLEALRSREYQQSRGYLTVTAVSKTSSTKTGYCCLGVLCALAARIGVVEAREEEGADGFRFVRYGKPGMGREEDEAALLPTSVMEWAGLDEANPRVPHPQTERGYREKYSLTSLNDGDKLTFDQIADAIEAGL